MISLKLAGKGEDFTALNKINEKKSKKKHAHKVHRIKKKA